LLACALGLGLGLGGRHAAADTVDLAATADNTLYESTSGALSNGAGQHIFAGATGDGLERRAVIRFDVASAIPSGSLVTSVELHLNMSRTRAGATPVDLHRLLADWGEGTSDAGGEEGDGTAATTGDATWIHTFFDTVSWLSPGGDFAGAASASTSVADLGPYTWASTVTLVADVQQWLDGAAANHGWLLLGSSAARTAKRFDSRDNPSAANRPRLTVVFTPPALGACCDGSGGCVEIDPAICTGTYQGDGSVCGAGDTCGACCDSATACEYKIDATCASYAGDGVSCDPDPCLAPLPGACCYADGTCAEVAAADCTGNFQGEGSTCGAGGMCGACCDGASCELTVLATCAGGYEGDGSSCDPNPCGTPTGACCQDTFCTDDTTESECILLDGIYQGDGQSCSTSPCADESRACCFPDESCIVMNRDVCDDIGGDRQGGSSTCNDNPCASIGACCLGTSCLPDMDHDDCEDRGGDFQGGQDCGPATCDEIRACCLPAGGGCTMMDERECDALGGEHHEPGVTCTPDPCALAPCSAALILPVERLLATKSGAKLDVDMTWSGDINADGYNVWYVTAKGAIPDASSVGPANAVPGCVGGPANRCVHTNAVAVAAGSRLFYNVLGTCDGTEAAE